MGRHSLCHHATEIPQSAAAIHRGIAVQQFLPVSTLRDANVIVQARHWSKIADDGDALLG